MQASDVLRENAVASWPSASSRLGHKTNEKPTRCDSSRSGGGGSLIVEGSLSRRTVSWGAEVSAVMRARVLLAETSESASAD